MLLCGRKFIDEGHSSSDEIKARCDQLQENWDELKNLAEQRCGRALLLVQLLDTLKIYSVFGSIATYQTHLPTVGFYFAGSINWTSLLPTSSSVLMSVKRNLGSMRRILSLEAMTMATR